MVNIKLFIKSVFLFIIIFFVSGTSIASLSVSANSLDFTLAGNINKRLASFGLSNIFGRLFIIGGADFNVYDQTYFIDVKNGLIVNKSESLQLPTPLFWQSSSSLNNFLYVLGGRELSGSYSNKVIYGLVDSMGNIDSWKETLNMNNYLALTASIIVGDTIYQGGGQLESTEQSSKVYYSKINHDGSLNSWIETEPLPLPSSGHTFINYEDNIYAIGRSYGNHVFGTKIKSDGSLEQWKYLEPLTNIAGRASVVRVGNIIYSIGGINNNQAPRNDYEYTTINSDGTLQPWQSVFAGFPRGHCCSPAGEVEGRIIIVGGHDGGAYFDEVWTSQQLISPTPYPSISPFPTPSPTAFPSPTSTPTPIPVTKTILVPGFGASWNSDALLNCKSTSYAGDWTLSQYAEDVYSPFIETMHLNKKYVYPYYYDWRRSVGDSWKDLRDFVNNLTETGEQVDIVGHSFGGLLTRAYIENSGGGKIRKAILVSTPNKGVVRSYPTWSGGEVWSDNLLFKIAQSFALLKCSGAGPQKISMLRNNFPAIGNLLPTFEYLRNWTSDELKSIESMNARNTYLPTNFGLPFNSIQFATVVGTGKKTPEQIIVRNRSKIDEILNIWMDGRPFSTKYSFKGDDTVLVDSAKIDGAENYEFKLSHWGTISNKRSINQMILFLGPNPLVKNIPNIDNSEYNVDSMIILVSQGTDFELDGKKSKDILTISNPKKVNKLIKITKTNKNKNITVIQFLKDGSTLSKEYENIHGFKNAKIDFDENKFKDSILRFE